MELALGRALRATALTPGDDAIVELARHYARGVDGGHLHQVGRSLAEVLHELGMTPKARALLLKDAKPQLTSSVLDELRAKRERRQA